MMIEHAGEAIDFTVGSAQPLPHTLSESHHLTLRLISVDAAQQTAVFQLDNPDAEPNTMAAGLIDQNAREALAENRWRDRLHLPEVNVPVDTETQTVASFLCRLHEKLEIGDRVWTVTSINDGHVTLTPGHDYEAKSLLNEAVDLEYSKRTIDIAEGFGGSAGVVP